MSARENWAGNISFQASELVRPTSVEELCEVVASRPRIRALGTGHSFNRIADTEATQVSLRSMPRVLEIDENARTVTVDAGARYGDFVGELNAHGWALHNLGSLPHISVAGACMTGTHGSGVLNGSLSSAVAAMELAGADGSLSTLHRGDDDFPGVVVSMGALGVATRLTLDIVPSFDVRQWVYEDMPWASVIDNLDDVLSRAYSVSLFTDWRTGDMNQVWVKQRMSEGTAVAPRQWLGATLATVPLNPVQDMSAANCTEQGGVPGAWYERLPHFRLGFTPSVGDEVQAEYFVAREHAVGALTALRAIGSRIAPVLIASELRTIARDDLWLSPFYARETFAVHFTLVKDEAAVTPVVRSIESALAPFSARPHWGKVFTNEADQVRSLYPRMADFVALASRLDPSGKFTNDYTLAYLG